MQRFFLRIARAVESFTENVALAYDSVMVAKGRSALTILGVVIGVATVMAMASVVRGIREQIVSTIEVAGPTTFYVVKVFSQTPLNPEDLPRWVRIRPDLQAEEAERIKELPEIRYAAMWGQVFGRAEFGGTRTQPGVIFGADAGYTEIQGGELTAGRWFTAQEIERGSAVAVLDADVANKLFGNIDPLDRTVQLGGRPAKVIGLYQPASNIFQPPGQSTHAIVPFRMLDHQFTIDKTNAAWLRGFAG
jgi:putative ABC transport system permease protein